MPTIYVLNRNIKILEFSSENFLFLMVKFSVYLNRHVFVMIVQSILTPSLSDLNNVESLPVMKGQFDFGGVSLIEFRFYGPVNPLGSC